MTTASADPRVDDDAAPAHRYTAALAGDLERRWQERWTAEGTFEAPNPVGALAGPVDDRPKRFVMDMFPYPSGSGIHVGHPLGYIATDVFARYSRMTGYNVLHTLGFDAFGLPAEQYAVQTGQHPRVTTEGNIATMRVQLGRLGLGHDARRSISTIDPDYYRWTQWIFLQVHASWYDREAGRARPIAELEAAYASGERPTPDGRAWSELTGDERAELLDQERLAYRSNAPVNWCPGLGTVLANEEVTADGRSERGNFPVFKRNLRQWMMRITAYADRLVDDLDRLDWPEPVKLMQRNWIGRSNGAHVDFSLSASASSVRVFTTRPDTLFGATYVVLAPEHELVDTITAAAWPEGVDERWTGGAATPAEAVEAYRARAAAKSEEERTADSREKTGVFTGAYAVNPLSGKEIPVFIADYVLAGYGTGAIMAVPAEDQRDWDFAQAFGLPVVRTVQPPEGFADDSAYTGDGATINSGFLDGLGRTEAKAAAIARLEELGAGSGTTTYKLRDWLFSRQRYWGEPFPVVYDEDGRVVPLPESMLPVTLPEVSDYSPRTFDPDDAQSDPEAPLGRNPEWVEVTLDLGDGPKKYRRDTNTMPNWAGSCWYHLRYIDPVDEQRLVEPENERYWMGPRAEGATGGVDLYVGGVEHAVLHLLYSRFWHKVLHDLGYVSSSEPYHKLFNQGYIQAYAYTDARGVYVPAAEVEEADGGWTWQGEPVQREYGKMGKSLKNSVTPDEMAAEYGADTLRLYEMSMGPLEVSRPWETRAVVGSFRFLQRLWRNVVSEETGELVVGDVEPDTELLRVLHRTIEGVRADFEALRFNTAVAKLIELNNAVTKRGGTPPRSVVEPLVLLLAPLAPHVAEELWSRLGHAGSLAHEPFPVADPALLAEETVVCVVQVAGKVRDRLDVAPDIGEDALRELALASEGVRRSLGERGIRTVIVRAPKLVNIVPA
ncbi:leucyl-tRNA synthetase [Motilibacter rhizosphaerae]|uniref:Leucine--tRNA ligase n=1 Tax=Motilibacter rhizosphaerae TaxID=598652 RepID=A0A4Q7NRN4_9ACTN|nr:leucine--tRNA ligase [Motilibacter rhizosphaerae]RZS89753.1 leucyl-tRNA synthetase [Motilibacter rhizosphaerae]